MALFMSDTFDSVFYSRELLVVFMLKHLGIYSVEGGSLVDINVNLP